MSRELLSLGLNLELLTEVPDSIITCTVPYKQFWTDQQRGIWLMDGSSKVNGLDPFWNATTMIKKGKNK